MITRRALGLGAALATLPRLARSQASGTLRVAFDAEWTSLDPHFHTFPYNLSVAYHLFDALTAHDAAQKAVPRLASTWRPIGTDAWEFRLRDDARFLDGTPVTAEDVIASVARIRAIRNSPGPLTTVIRPVAGVAAPDPRTVVFTTSVPTPALPNLLTSVFIVPARLADATQDDFATGRAQIGSGPFRFISYARGDRLVLEPNPVHWGERPGWGRTELRIITNAGAREAALMAGDVDFIVNPTTTSVERLGADPNFAVHKAFSTRITYLQMHQGETPKADMGGTGGKNPFADPRVRRAVSLAIPREAICARIMDGLALPASQILGPGQSGHDPALGVEPQDLDAARRLLDEAGWAQGFETRLSTPSDRNMNGRRAAEAIAAALTRIGIRTTVNANPLNVWLAEWRRGEYSMILHGAGPVPVPWTLVPQLVGTRDMRAGFGPSNESHYSNPALDAVMREALAEIDTAKREALLHRAARTVREETAIVPLHHEAAIWASRKGLAFAARSDTLTYATDIRPG